MRQRETQKVDDEKAEKEREAERQNKERAYQEKMNHQDEGAGLGDTNLSFFKRMGKETQFLVGCGLIAIIFSSLYLALNYVSTNLQSTKKKRN